MKKNLITFRHSSHVFKSYVLFFISLSIYHYVHSFISMTSISKQMSLLRPRYSVELCICAQRHHWEPSSIDLHWVINQESSAARHIKWKYSFETPAPCIDQPLRIVHLIEMKGMLVLQYKSTENPNMYLTFKRHHRHNF